MKRDDIGSNLARQGKVDVRRDEDQNAKLTQLIKLLIDAGYFRARVKGLSPFDKIVGGMTWCIEVCNFDIDVDLLFHENLTIGNKISLTEKIVQVLPYMKCPYSIEPHQIQGLDSIHIYPVIKWLVKQALETRVEYQNETRNISLNEFERHYQIETDQDEYRNMKRIKELNDIKIKYGPKRRYKADLPSANLAQPLTTLLEYQEMSYADSDTESIDEEDKEFKENLCEKMTSQTISARPNIDVVSKIVENQASHLAAETQILNLKKNAALASNNIVCELKTQNNNIEEEIKKLSNTVHSAEIKENDIKHKIGETEETINNIVQEINKSENSYNDDALNRLSLLLEDITTSKAFAASFKEKCRLEAEEFRQAISKTNSDIEVEKDITSEELIESHGRELKKLKRVKMLVAQKTKEVESLKRTIDDVPGRAELFQYQRRFVELYNLVGAEHHETLQFFNMFNALADSLLYMKKEHDLLNSILDNMEQGLSTDLEEYVAQLKNIIEGINHNKVKMETKRNEKRNQRIALANEVHRLQDLQIYYARILHLFSQEIGINESLLLNEKS